MRLTCHKCRRSIISINNDIESITTCSECGKKLEIADNTEIATPQMPKHFKLSRNSMDIILDFRFKNIVYVIVLIMCFLPVYVVLILLLILLYFAMHPSYAISTGEIISRLATVLIPLIIFGYIAKIGTTKMILWLDRAEIKINTENLSISYFPIPIKRNSLYLVRDIDNIFCEEKAWLGRYGINHCYYVVILQKNGSRYNFVAELDYPEQALFIAETIKQYLKVCKSAVNNEDSLPCHEFGAQKSNDRTLTTG